MKEKPVCNKCGCEMIWTKAKNINFEYWACPRDCIIIHPVWDKELTTNEKRFIKDLK